jgi:hypothetical protein
MHQRLDDYLTRLPDGLASFPECRVKASLFRAALASYALGIPREGLPEPLVRLFDSPPPVTEWLPEVLSVAAHYAIIDAHELSDEAAVDWMYQTNRQLAQSRLYRAITAVASPQLALRGAKLAWGMIRKGINLSVSLDGDSARVTVTHPDGVWTELVHQATATGIRAVLESSRGTNVQVKLAVSRSDRAIYDCSWT